MINANCFTLAWLESFKKQRAHSMIQANILEKMIYALHLLEELRINGLEFVFKGGTSLVLLLKEDNRFSIDIDIICKTDRKILEDILDNVVESSQFNKVTLDEKRSYQPDIPKAHYIFQFDSVFKTKAGGKILLDVLIEDSIYPEHTEVAVQSKWIETNDKTLVTVPTIDAIAGDKLTAFAPNTIGIPYYKGDQSFSMEICKQLFDLSRLFNRIDNLQVVAKSFEAHATQEIGFRNNAELTPSAVLQDTIDTCLIITKRGRGGSALEGEHFQLLQEGIRSFGTGYLMTGNFRIDDAIVAAARVAYLAAKFLVGDTSPLQFYNGQDISTMTIESPEWSFLNRLKRQPDKSTFYYWYHIVELLVAKE